MHSFLMAPANWILLTIIAACCVKHKQWRKRLLILASILFVLFSNKALYTTVMKWWQPSPVDLRTKKFDTGILLGGISWFEENNNGYMSNGADRFIQANKLYHLGVIKKILLSAGGVDSSHKEAAFLKQQLVDAGVAANDIVLEERSVNTYENALYSKRVIDSLGLQPPFVLITSAFHIPRAKRVFAKAGIAVVPYPCDFEATNRKLPFTACFLPNLEVLKNWGGLLKEWAGLVVYKLQGKI